MSMAETVGIGRRGKNSLIYHAKYGPRLMLGGLITTTELPQFIWPEKDDAGCPDDCRVCMEVCPVGAISENGDVDRLACIRHSMKSPLFSFLMKAKAFDSKDAAMINHVTAVDDHSWYTCIKCVSECPHL
jgi:epoxyqueuosine reductase